MGLRTMRVDDDGFAYEGIAHDEIGPPTIGIGGNGPADDMSTDETAPDDAAAPDDEHRQRRGR